MKQPEEFQDGQLLIPDNRLAAAFYYYKNEMDLVENVEYRVATTRERIYYEKNIRNSKEAASTVSEYKNAKSAKVSEITNPNTNGKPYGRF